MFGFSKKNKLGSISVETSKKVAFSRMPSRLRVDGIFRKEKFVKEEIKTEKVKENKRSRIIICRH